MENVQQVELNANLIDDEICKKTNLVKVNPVEQISNLECGEISDGNLKPNSNISKIQNTKEETIVNEPEPKVLEPVKDSEPVLETNKPVLENKHNKPKDSVFAFESSSKNSTVINEQVVAPEVKPGHVDLNLSLDSVPKDNLKEIFSTAGKENGVQIWRLEDLNLKPIKKEDYGHFYSGDSYIILDTIKFRDNSYRWNIHFWLGDKSTVDETAAAAVITAQMDHHLGGYARQFRERQGAETDQFMKYFKNGIFYKDGGYDGVRWKSTKSNYRSIQRLLHLKGRKNVRAREVLFSWDSFNEGDCFIIEINNNIYTWKGVEANGFEALKANQMATLIRDNEAGGRSRITHLEQGRYVPKLVTEILGPAPEVFNPATPDIAVTTRRFSVMNSRNKDLYHICADTGELVVNKIGSTPSLTKDMLLTGDSFILDNGVEGSIFVWKGRLASKEERSGAMEYANKFITDKGYSNKTQIVVLPEGSETVMFKEFFLGWIR